MTGLDSPEQYAVLPRTSPSGSGTASRGVGVILLHHGSYFTGGKEVILEVIAANAWGSVVWNPNGGQNLIKVPQEQFSTTNAVEYSDTIEQSLDRAFHRRGAA